MRLPDFIRHDLGLKLAALALGIFLWVNVAERRPVELVVDLPIKYNIASDLTFVSQVPTKAKARIRGKGKFLRWRLGDVYFLIDLSPAGKGIVTHVVSPGGVQIPPEKDIEVIEVIEPKAIRVELDKLVTIKLPPRVIFKGSVPRDRVMIGKPVTEPKRIVVAGAKQLLDTLTAVPTEPVDLGQLAKKGKVTAKIDLGGLPYVTSDTEEITVIARVEPRKELGIPSVPIEPKSKRRVKAKFTPDSLDIFISGAESQIDSLDLQDLKIVVDVSDLPRGQLIFHPYVKEGRLHFKVWQAGKDISEEPSYELTAEIVAPYRLEVIEVSPEEIGFVQR